MYFSKDKIVDYLEKLKKCLLHYNTNLFSYFKLRMENVFLNLVNCYND